jgi:secreted PhoX family phosphatase
MYVIDEFSAGGIYKFVPDRRGDLSEGQLYVLKVDDTSLVTNPDRVGPAKWIALDRDDAQIDAQAAAITVGVTGYGRPEDIEIRSNVMYIAITSVARATST